LNQLMEKQRKELVILPDDSIVVREIHQTRMEIGDSLIERLCENRSIAVLNVFDIEDVAPSAHGRFYPGDLAYYTVPIFQLPLRAPYRMVQGVLVPNFSSRTDPIIDMTWSVPHEIRLMTLLQVQNNPMCAGRHATSQWLFAMDPAGACYRLPLGNLHSDGKLCTGQSAGFMGKTDREAVNPAMKQFKSGQWNSDLWNSNANTQRMFRFKPVNDKDGPAFIQQVMDCSYWVELCEKIAPGVIKEIVDY
jgi:hypothetical protein